METYSKYYLNNNDWGLWVTGSSPVPPTKCYVTVQVAFGGG